MNHFVIFYEFLPYVWLAMKNAKVSELYDNGESAKSFAIFPVSFARFDGIFIKK